MWRQLKINCALKWKKNYDQARKSIKQGGWDWHWTETPFTPLRPSRELDPHRAVTKQMNQKWSLYHEHHLPLLKLLPQRKNVLVDVALVQSYHIHHWIIFWMQIWEYKSFYRTATQFITLPIYSSNYLLKGSPLQNLANCEGPECTVMLACMKQSALLMIWRSPMLFLNI